MDEVERHFNVKTDKFSNEIIELTELIDKGKAIIEEYSAVSAAKKDADLLRRLVEMADEAQKAVSAAEKSRSDPIVSTTVKVIFDKNDEIAESLKRFGRVEETVDLPAPANFRVTEKRYNYADLSWDKVEASSTYQVMAKKTAEPDEKWTEVYNGPDTSYRCSNLEQLTEYTFRVAAVYKGIKSPNSSTCSARTVNGNRWMVLLMKMFVFQPVQIKHNTIHSHSITPFHSKYKSNII